MPTYKRTVIGFDLRMWSATQKNVATIDTTVWPSALEPGVLLDQNGFNLFDSPVVSLTGVSPPDNCLEVAFDLPAELVNLIADTFGIKPTSIEESSAGGKWEFLGYDVVDARTQSSAYYSFDWHESELDGMLGQSVRTFNQYGLIEDEAPAIGASVAFDALIKEHAPFAPCGVWVRKWMK